MKAIVLLSVLAATVTGIATAQTASELERAKALYDKANARLEANETVQALELFRRSREVVPSVYNTQGEAYCLYRLGRHDEALDKYLELKREHAEELSDDASDALEGRIAELRKKTAALTIAGPEGAALFVDGKRRGTLPRAEAIYVLPGEHLVRVTPVGKPHLEKAVEVDAGATFLVELRIPSSPPPRPRAENKAPSTPPPSPTDSSSSLARTAGWISLGIGAVGLGVGSYFGIRAIQKKNESDREREGDACFQQCHDAWSDGQSAARVSTIAFGVGIVGAAAGGYLVLSSRDRVSQVAGEPLSLRWSRRF